MLRRKLGSPRKIHFHGHIQKHITQCCLANITNSKSLISSFKISWSVTYRSTSYKRTDQPTARSMFERRNTHLMKQNLICLGWDILITSKMLLLLCLLTSSFCRCISFSRILFSIQRCVSFHSHWTLSERQECQWAGFSKIFFDSPRGI